MWVCTVFYLSLVEGQGEARLQYAFKEGMYHAGLATVDWLALFTHVEHTAGGVGGSHACMDGLLSCLCVFCQHTTPFKKTSLPVDASSGCNVFVVVCVCVGAGGCAGAFLLH